MSNILVNQKDNGIKIKINTAFYPKEIILKTAENFKDLCWIDLAENPEGCVSLCLKLKNKNVDCNKIGFEFMNHLLAEMKEIEDF
jgi:hypothetical protein